MQNLLKKGRQKLETVNEMHRFFELATRNSQITVFYQDTDLRYRWIVNPRLGFASKDIVGKTDEDILPEEGRAVIVGHKRRAITTRATQTFEVELPEEGERSWYRVDVVPILDGGRPTGIVCTAIDITKSKRLDRMRADLSRRLAETLQRFNLALRSERITVFAQDLDLRYTWANTSETQVGSIVGRTDEDLLPPEDREPIVSLKRRVIADKSPDSAEVGVGRGAERRWYDLHVEPNLSSEGEVTGLTGASIDVTHRRRNEEQMRLVLRELTHRTKNLLTVVIAIARQTASHAATVDEYVPALIARLRALSAAQDLIVADDWAGVDIADLVRVLVGQYIPPQTERLELDGPPIILSPEASQNLGLAIHELAANAARFGALSNVAGKLSVQWHVKQGKEDDLLAFTWRERGGPVVLDRPSRRGFGMTVIERNLTRALDAEVDIHFEEAGLTVEVVLPLRGVLPFASPDRVGLAEAS
jgi:PAS domain S-box-containing protein